jgi:hypothetical protein
LKALLSDIVDKGIFGEVVGIANVTEFQKRGIFPVVIVLVFWHGWFDFVLSLRPYFLQVCLTRTFSCG